jgi:cystathionine beta-lyase family protein involved in aluminum resistance
MLPYRFSPILLETANKAEALCVHAFRNIDDVYQITSEKVLRAFISNRVSDAHLKGTTGYGYGDLGRDTLDQVFANVLDAEDALVRHTFVNGTHALSVGLFGLLREHRMIPYMR